TYSRYADSQLANQNFFYAADGFRWAAEAYGTFNDDEHLRKMYSRAVETYIRFIEFMEEQESLTPLETRRIAEAYQNIGICHAAIDEIEPAKDFFEKSKQQYQNFIDGILDHQEKRDMVKYVDVVDGNLQMIDGKLAITHGDYEDAEKCLNNAFESFEKAITKGGWSVDYEKGMEKKQEEIRSLLEDIKAKPSFSAELPEEVEAVVGATSTFRFKVSNVGEESILDVSFLVHFPEELGVSIPPEKIPELKSESEEEVVFSFKPTQEGEYTFEPLNITYRDKEGHKYLRGTSKLSVKVSSSVGGKEKDKPEAKPAGGGGGLDVEFDYPDKVKKGEEFTVRVKITNTSKFRVLHTVDVDFTSAEEVVHSHPPIQKLEKILPGKRQDEAFKLKAKKDGKLKIPVKVSWENQTREDNLTVKAE
ncbi:hypothetical protein ACFLRC_02565, partial [Candidatus Altiarchaeota archaeon]